MFLTTPDFLPQHREPDLAHVQSSANPVEPVGPEVVDIVDIVEDQDPAVGQTDRTRFRQARATTEESPH